MVCFCRAAQLRLCADGGSNRLFDEMPRLLADENENDVRNRYLIFYFNLVASVRVVAYLKAL